MPANRRVCGRCPDCNGPLYQYFSEATQLWSWESYHSANECVRYLKRRLDALEYLLRGSVEEE